MLSSIFRMLIIIGIVVAPFSLAIEAHSISQHPQLTSVRGSEKLSDSLKMDLESGDNSPIPNLLEPLLPITKSNLVAPSALPHSAEAATILTLSNDSIIFEIIETGQFTMRSADGRYLLYPDARTSYISVNIDDKVYYSAQSGTNSLSIVTPPTIHNSQTASIEYGTPEGIQIVQRFFLDGPAVRFETSVYNTSNFNRNVQIRYLFDTQVDINDGSPLYASNIGVRTTETNLETTSFVAWEGYDIWPNPSLSSVGTLASQPNRVVFAWWPEAAKYPWSYDPNPNQAFYVPGYTTSPTSDSCVLLYFSLGVLGSNDTQTITTYYGSGAPIIENGQDKVISAYYRFKEALKSSILADVDAYASTQAQYLSSLGVSWKDYVEITWGYLSGQVASNSSMWGKLGKEAKFLRAFIDAVDQVSISNTIAKQLYDIHSTIPTGLSEDDIKRNYILPRLMTQMQFEPVTGGLYYGLNDFLDEIDSEYDKLINDLVASPLPPDYPVEEVVAFLDQQTATLTTTTIREASVPLYYQYACHFAILGNLQNHKSFMNQLSNRLDYSENFSWSMTLTSMGVVAGGSVLKVAGVVGMPVTVGSSSVVLIPSETLLWGGVANVVSITGILGTLSDFASMTLQGQMSKLSIDATVQFSNDLELRRFLFRSSTSWLKNPYPILQVKDAHYLTSNSNIEVVSVDAPNLTVDSTQTIGEGNITITLRNTSNHPITATLYGNVTTSINDGMSTINLVGSVPTYLPSGAIAPVQITYQLIRSSLVDKTGYILHLFIAEASEYNLPKIQGPYVSQFYVGTEAQLAILTTQKFQTLQRGEIQNNNVLTIPIQFGNQISETRLLLSFSEHDDLDIHLYDTNGQHTGVNYDSGLVENNIFGVNYSGPNSWPELMVINGSEVTGIHTIVLVPRNLLIDTLYDLSKAESSLMSAIVDSPKNAEWSVVRTLDNLEISSTFGILLAESSGTHNIEEISVHLLNFSGHGDTIQKDCLSPATLPAGTMMFVDCSILVPSTVPIGTYTSTLLISGRQTGNKFYSTETQIELTVNSFNPISTPIPTPTPKEPTCKGFEFRDVNTQQVIDNHGVTVGTNVRAKPVDMQMQGQVITSYRWFINDLEVSPHPDSYEFMDYTLWRQGTFDFSLEIQTDKRSFVCFGQLIAKEMPTSTLTPVPTSTPTSTLTPVPTSTPTSTLTPVPTSTPTSTFTPSPTSTSVPNSDRLYLPVVQR